MIEAILAGALQVAAAPVFAPPLDTPMTLRFEQARDHGDGKVAHYTIDRRIVFRRAGDGYLAEMTQRAASVDRSGDAFARILSRIATAPVVYRLDRAGKIVSVENGDALWRRFETAMEQELGKSAGDLVRSMPQAARVTMMGSALQDVLAPDVAGEGPVPPEPVRVPAAPLAGSAPGAMLDGTREVRAEGGKLLVATRAQGSLAAPAGASSGIATDIRVDPRTGLVERRRDRVDSRLASGAKQWRETIITLRYPDTRSETRANP